MNPLTGRVYSEAEVAKMTKAERDELVMLEGSKANVDRISKAVQAMNRAERRAMGQRGPKA